MANVRLIVRNVFDEAVLNVTDSVTPIESTQQSRRTRWRSATDQIQVISGQLGDYAFADGIALAHHNLLAGAQWRLVLKDNSITVYDSAWLDTVLYIPAAVFLPGITPWMSSHNEKLPVQMCVHWFETLPFNRFELHLKPASNVAFSEIGRIFLGQSLSPNLNMDYGCQLSYIEHGEHRRSSANGLWTIGSGVSREFEMNLNHLDAEQRSSFALELVSQGIEKDLLISAYPERGDTLELEHTLIGKRKQSFISPHSGFDEWNTKLTFSET